MKNLSAFAVLLITLFSASVYADDGKTNQHEPEYTSLKEIGLTLGTPAGLNLVLGYWSLGDFPWLVRVSGMSFGSNLEGIQGDLGWVFYQREHFKQYLAATFVAFQIHDDGGSGDFHHARMAGPTYGFNWHGFALQAGLGFGFYNTTHPDSTPNDSYSVQALAQLGYTFLF